MKITTIHSLSEENFLSRENAMTLRETRMLCREETGNQRESAAEKREHAVDLREAACREAEAMKISLEHLILKLKQANQQLVLSAIQTQAVSEEVQKAQDRMTHMAHHDFLTDLPNRALLKEQLVQAISLAKRHNSKLAVLFIDLNRFKIINDSQGHAIGDLLLIAVAQRLLSVVRGSDTVSRQGGDEFIVLMPEVADEEAVASFAEKICQAISVPYRLAGQDLKIGATIGISLYPEDGEEAEKLIQNADVAMYHSKRTVSDRYRFFRPQMNARAIERQVVETNLLHALERQELAIFYQPKVNLITGKITGAEALVRWIHPEWGMVLPDRFLPIAESCGLIVPIGRWVLEEACAQAVRWKDVAFEPITVAVNISAPEFQDKSFVDNLCNTLRQTGLDPRQLQLEITESVLMLDAEFSLDLLNKIRGLGVQLTMDDFGAGYSSLSYLNKFPIDVLKIDRSFLQGIGSARDDRVIASAMISMGTSLKLRIIAEGVENQAQLAYLKAQHCDEGQGHLFSRPLPPREFSELVAAGIPQAVSELASGPADKET